MNKYIISTSRKISLINTFKSFIPKKIAAFSQVETIKLEKEKKHNELNKKLQEYRNFHQFDIYKTSELQNKFISESQKHKQTLELSIVYKNFEDSIKNGFENFEEKKFMLLLSKISQTLDNSIVMKNPRFQEIIEKLALKPTFFKDYINFCLFIGFCSVNKLENNEIWSCFQSYIMNIKDNLSSEAKCMILMNFSPINEKYFDVFFEIFEKEFEIKINSEKIILRNVFDILYIYRKFDRGSDSFYLTINNFIQKELHEISIDNLILLISYYSQTSKEKQETIIKFMNLFEKRLFQLMSFLNSQEILQVMFGYLKLNLGSKELFKKLEERAINIIDKFNIQEIEKLIFLIANSPKKSVIFDAIEKEILKNIKSLKPFNFPGIFFMFSMNNMGTELFYSIMSDKISNSIFLYSPDQISKLVWSFSIKMPSSDLLFKKAQEYIIENTEKFTITEIANLVWSFTEAKKGSNLLFIKLEEQIARKSMDITIKEVAKIFWGYVNKLALSKKTVDNFIIVIKNKFNEVDCWDLATILWAFSRFRTDEYDEIYKVLEEKTKELCEEMNNYEFVTSLRAYSEKKHLSNELLNAFLKKLEFSLNSLNENEIIILINCFLLLNKSNTNIENLLEKLWKKLKDLESNSHKIINKNISELNK